MDANIVLSARDALVIVDVQIDFCPGGALGIPRGDEVVPLLNEWIAAAREAHALVVATRDWHPADHVSFKARGGPWPPHCVQGTPGAELHPDLALPEDVIRVEKAKHGDQDSYSAFDGTDLAEQLHGRGIRRLVVGGLALDYCVRATVLDGLAEGFDVHVLLDATRPVEANPGDAARAVDDMRRVGASIVTGRNTLHPERAGG